MRWLRGGVSVQRHSFYSAVMDDRRARCHAKAHLHALGSLAGHSAWQLGIRAVPRFAIGFRPYHYQSHDRFA